MSIRTMLAMILLAASSVAARPVHAVDGVIEINEARALAGGITPGDAPGYPITLSLPGSYVLTGDLLVDGRVSSNTNIVEIPADGVTFDLNGFQIAGRTACTGTGASVSCAPGGSGRGVDATGSGVLIRNGLVTGQASNGIFASLDARIEGVRAFGNGGNGIFASAGSVIHDCQSSRNGGGGLVGSTAVVVRDSVARGNKSHGIFLQTGGRIAGSVTSGNGEDGVLSGARMLVSDTNAGNNGGRGIAVGAGSNVVGSTASGNDGAGVVANSSTLQGLAVVSNALGIDATRSTIRDVTANSNAGAGIDAGEGSNVRSSTAAANQGNGILSVAYAVIADSAAFANGAIGISAANGNLVRGNVVAENATGVGSLLGDNRVEENHLLSNTCGFCEIGLGRSLLTKNSARVNTTDYAFGSSWSGGIWNSPIRTNCAGGPCVNETAPPWVNFALGD